MLSRGNSIKRPYFFAVPIFYAQIPHIGMNTLFIFDTMEIWIGYKFKMIANVYFGL
ncbi:hypothetical protein LCGC14_1173430 [marine sediment metagenome]|uniref:Uncharacterized protein n=1 Tax=marine sediment metagenome TaxID=412755 RepID=A0A0F9PUN9_9ZZZZ